MRKRFHDNLIINSIRQENEKIKYNINDFLFPLFI